MRGEPSLIPVASTASGRAITAPPLDGARGPTVLLRVLDGPQAGIETVLPPGRFRIGRDLANDIVLADPSVAPAHALLLVDARGARLQPLVAGQAMPRGRIAPGQPVEFRLGETRLGLEVGAAFDPAPSPWRRLPLLGAAAAIVLGLASAALTSVALAPGMAHPAEAPRAPASPAPHPPAAAPALTEAAQALADRLAEAGLAGAVTVTLSAGALVARGTLPPEAMTAWRSVQEWYDGAHPAGPVLLRDVAAARLADRPRLMVQAVWTGAMPYLITADGERYAEGAVIDGGWTIERIEASRILLSRAGRTVTLGF
jgi:type III secretion protein D